MPASRKRRRSTDKLLNEFTQRGISVQHVASDARQLNANDIGQLQHLFQRSHRNRLGQLAFRHTVRLTPTTSQSSSPNTNAPDERNRSSAMSVLLRHLPSLRVRDLQNNDTDRLSNRIFSANIPRIERPSQQTNGSNINSNWPFLRVGNSTLNELYRCAVASRNQQQQTSDASRQSDQVRLIRRIRRARPSTNSNTQGGR